jgi:endonuclease/exonuclease/phosphatase family metal-dependent hydrolase
VAKKKTKNKNFRLVTKILLILNILAAASLLLSYLSLYISPEKNWILPFFGLLYPYLLLLNILFILWWLFRFRFYFLLSAAAILLGYNVMQRTFQVEASSEPLPRGNSFKVLTYNVRNMSNNNLLIADPKVSDAIVNLLKDSRPDIVCLQEFEATGDDPLKIVEQISQTLGLPHYSYTKYNEKSRKRLDAIITFSRYPILGSLSIKKDDLHNFCLINDILFNEDTIRLYNVHLESVRLRHEDYTFIEDLDLQFREDENIKEGSRRLFNKLRDAFIIRSAQVKNLRGSLQSSPYPVILCGDFNDTPCSYSYQVLSRGKKDAFIESGSGLGNTYAGTLPSLRIDYILYDRTFKSYSYTTGREKLSDHFPIAATLSYREP